jgi:CCR4-NOT transcription complex subunit 3
VDSRAAPPTNGAITQSPADQSGPSSNPIDSQPSSAPQQNGNSVPQQAQQPMPQYPPGVKAPVSELPPPGLAGAAQPQQQQQPTGARPTSTAPQPMLTQQTRPNPTSGFPGSLSDLVLSFENVKQKGQLHVYLSFFLCQIAEMLR